jgi:hypothetical protein
MEFKCTVCNYISPSKFSADRHINKQKKCGENPEIEEIPIEIECNYCNKSYKSRDNLFKHLKICKVKKHNIEEEEKNKLLREEENKLLREELIKANKKIASISINRNNNNNNNDTINRNNNNNDTINNIINNKSTIRTKARKIYKKNYKILKCVHCKNNNQNNIQICHIKAVSEFNQLDFNVVNNLSNLISLCANCHLDYDKGKNFKVCRTVIIHNFIIKHLQVYNDSITEKAKKYPEVLEKLNEYLDLIFDEEVAKLIKKKVALILYTNRHMIK